MLRPNKISCGIAFMDVTGYRIKNIKIRFVLYYLFADGMKPVIFTAATAENQ
jgi:hypothetical protein